MKVSVLLKFMLECNHPPGISRTLGGARRMEGPACFVSRSGLLSVGTRPCIYPQMLRLRFVPRVCDTVPRFTGCHSASPTCSQGGKKDRILASEMPRDGVWGGCSGALLGRCNRSGRRTLAAKSRQLLFLGPGSKWKLLRVTDFSSFRVA